MVRFKGCVVAAAVYALALCGSAKAQTSYWQIGDSNSWYDGSNWSSQPLFLGGEVEEDDLAFNLYQLNAAITSTVDNPTSIASLTFIGTGEVGTSLLLSSGTGGTLTIANSLTDSSANPVVISVPILGTANLVNNGGGSLTLSGANMYSGGTSIESGTLVIGSSSVGTGSGVSQGPVGTGTLMLSGGTNLTTADSSSYTLGNDITLCGGGTVTLLGGSMGTTLTLSGMISGSSTLEIAAPGCSGADTVTLLSSCSTFSGGVTVDAGNSTLVVGASSSGSPGDLDSGPLGTGMLTLGAGTNFTTAGNGCYTIDNAICLPGGGTVYLLQGSMGTMLTLGGMISGSSTLEIAAPGCSGADTVTLLSSCSTFSGGVTVDAGTTTLVVGASSSGSPGDLNSGPLGTGMLTLGAGTNFTTSGSGCYTIDNAICLPGGGTVYLLQGSMGTMLTLGGMISGSSSLEITNAGCDGSNTVTFTSSCSSFSGGVTVDAGDTTLVVGASSTGTGNSVTAGPLGTGTLSLGDGTDLTTSGSGCFTIGNNINLSGGGSGTVYLLGGGGGTNGTMLELGGMITGSSALEVEAPEGGDDDESPNSVYLMSSCSTFSGGVRVDAGYTGLFVGASSTGTGYAVTQGPLGTGTLMLSDGNDFETTPGSDCITIGNNITLCGGGTVYIEASHGGNMLTLSGMISGGGALDVGYDATNYLALTSGCSTFTGGVSVESGSTTLAVGASSTGGTGSNVTAGPLGTGTLMLSSGNTFTTAGDYLVSIGNNITLCGGGTVTLMGGTMGGTLELDGMVSGASAFEIAASSCESPNAVTLTSGCSTFSGGVSVDSGSTTLAVGASSTGTGSGVTEGPLGTGTLMLSSGNTFTTTGSGCYTIGNNIVLCDGGTVTLLGGSMGTMLTLSGMITGSSELEIASPEGGGTNSTTLASSCSTFSGGVTVDSGQNILVVGASGTGTPGAPTSSPLGTGTLTMESGAVLTTPSGTPITVLNNIALGAGGDPVYLGGVSSGTLTLLGTISEYCGQGSLSIFGPVDFEGCNTYSGGTAVNETTVTVGTNTGLGTGQVTANSSTLNFTSASPTVYDLTLNGGSTVNFAAGSSPTIVDMASDTSGSGNAINLGSGSNTTLTIQVDSDPTYYGTINGNGVLVVTSNSGGQLDLENANTYTGGTTVNAGALVVAGNNQALSSGPVTLNPSSALGTDHGVTITNQILIPGDQVAIGGYGSISPASPENIAIQSGSGVTGGRGTIGTGDAGHLVVGTLSFGANATLVLGGAGSMQFSLMNATGTPGTDFSQIDVAGTANITASGVDPFTIQLVGVASDGLTIGTANTFNASQPYSWTLLSAGTITGNLSSSAFVVDSGTYFSNPTSGGLFSVSVVGNDLTLNFTPVPEPSTWALMAGGICAAFGAAVRRRRRS
jgi:autotransporter-associated beta strand protein